MTEIQTTPRFSAQMWAAFWAAPELSQGLDILADDIVGYWPGQQDPVRGLDGYQQKIAELMVAYPDLRLELIDSATVPGDSENEELVFLHYVGTATGPTPPRTATCTAAPGPSRNRRFVAGLPSPITSTPLDPRSSVMAFWPTAIGPGKSAAACCSWLPTTVCPTGW